MKKERQRYLLFKIITENEIIIEERDLIKAIWSSIWRYFGMKEATKTGLWLLELNIEQNYGILRCSHETKESIISALTLITTINGERIVVSPIKTSGTVKAIKKIRDSLF